MIYKDFKGSKLSALGLGCMRLPTKGSDSEIDVEKAREIVAYAMKKGINYYDTAWGYHGGQSETVMGEILSEYDRDSFYLASKFPGYDPANMKKVKEIFERQLEKCRVDYFDFYLFHTLSESNVDGYLDPENGIFDYLCEQKRNGRIRHLGFSSHCSLETMERFLDAYGHEIEFGMIQLNWFDWDFQYANRKVELLTQRNIPVWVMEPVRGGKLCNLDEKYAEQLRTMAPDRTLPQWAFRFIQGIPEVKVTLSGMSDLKQLRENIETFETCEPLNAEETKLILSVAKEMRAVGTLPCTSCRYCLDYCPQTLNIPWIIELYNEQKYKGGEFRVSSSLLSQPEDKRPTACIGCGACESVCPQNIKISEMMADFASKMK